MVKYIWRNLIKTLFLFNKKALSQTYSGILNNVLNTSKNIEKTKNL